LSDSQESSYYEVALSNRQVLITFVVLLSCMVVAFLSGVWVGNKDSVETTSQVAETTESPPQSASDELGDLDFFADGRETGQTDAPLAQVAEAARPDTTLREEVSQQVQAGSSPAASRAPAPAPPPVQASPATAPAKEPPAVTDRGVPTDGPSVIQVFSSRDQNQADRLVDRLMKGGYPAFVISEDVDGTTVFRVRIGPYPERDRAEEVAVLVKKSFKLDTWITR
jgi:DedD protein